MSEKQGYNIKKKKKNLLPWLNGQHRLALINDQTFTEEKNWRLNTKNVLIFSSVVFFVVTVLIILLMKFTPLGRIVGVQSRLVNKEGRKEMEKLYANLDSLNRELKGALTYVESLKKISSESFEYEKDIKKPENTQKTETLTTFADVPKKSEETRQVIDNPGPIIKNANLVQPQFLESASRIDKSAFVSPVRGVVSDTFAPARGHYGTDIVAPKGTVVKAVKNGTVIMSSWSSDTGHMIGIQHDNNLLSWYKHNSSNLKKLGDRVSAGEAIAIIGNSGEMSNGPHLHFELWFNGQPVNAQKYVEF